MDHLDLYRRELQHFRGSARAFAERHPEVAGQLGSDDPDLERLIEAHAFLTAGVHAHRARGTRRTYAPLHDLSPEPGAPRC